jgi:undecaprenyl-diphosphatase
VAFSRRVAAFDAAVDDAFDSIRGPRLDGFMYRLSSAADHSLLWQFLGVAQALVHGGDVEGAARFAAAMGIESALTNGPIKLAFKRVRPLDYSLIDFQHGLRRPVTSSFPSGHATAAFCAATLLGGGPGWYSLAALVASTRVYVRLHHASDVVAGAALGVGMGLAMRRFVRQRGMMTGTVGVDPDTH